MTLKPIPNPNGHHGRGAPTFELSNGEQAQIHFWQSDLEKQSLPLENQQLQLKRPKSLSGYHALVIEKHSDTTLESIQRYDYFNGKPGGFSPAVLLSQPKTPLEIIPAPLPREHYRYYSGSEWAFIIRFNDKPLASAPVMLTTANGSHIETVSDALGMVNFTLPEDFKDIQVGRRANKPQPFHLSVRWDEGGKHYHSQLQAMYYVNPKHWQSTSWGIAVVVLGLISGGWLGRRGLKTGAKA